MFAMEDPILQPSSGSSGISAFSRINCRRTASELTSDLPTSLDRLIHNQLKLLLICDYLCHTWCHLHVLTLLIHVQYLHLVTVNFTA